MHNKTYITIGIFWIVGIVLTVNALLSAQSVTSQPAVSPGEKRKEVIPLPTVTQAQLMSVGSIGRDTKLCPGQKYAISWSANGKINTASLSFTRPALPGSNTIIAENVTFGYSEKEKMTTGKYEWVIGNQEDGVGAPAAGEGYAFLLTATSDEGENYAVSDPFTILGSAECQSFITPVALPTVTDIPAVTLTPVQVSPSAETATPEPTP